MPFQRPTLNQLIERVDADIKGGLNITTILRRSFLGVISRALAGLSHLLHGYLDFISLQTLPDTGEEDTVKRWATMFDVPRKESTFSEFNIDIVFTDAAIVAQNTAYQRGWPTVFLDAEVSSPGAGTVQGKLVAQVSGEAGNVEIGDTLSLLSPIANVESDALATVIIIDAEDQETLEAWRARLITRLRLPPLGGSANDYVQWALEVPGVTRAWVLPLYLGPGTVGVSFVEDAENPIIPSPAKVAEVAAYIEDLKPVTALVTVFAPVEAPMDMTIKIKPNTVDVQNTITSELEDLVKRDATLAGSYKAPGETNDGSILLSKINQAISIAVGIEDHEIVDINTQPPANVVPLDGELITLGTITWQPLA